MEFWIGFAIGFLAMIIVTCGTGYWVTWYFKRHPQVFVQKGMRYMMGKRRENMHASH